MAKRDVVRRGDEGILERLKVQGIVGEGLLQKWEHLRHGVTFGGLAIKDIPTQPDVRIGPEWSDHWEGEWTTLRDELGGAYIRNN